MFDYDSIRSIAKTIGRPVTDLLALTASNDPFYVGIKRRRRDAEWFADIWREYGGKGSHLRRLHYQLISSATPRIKPDGGDYQNTENDWQILSSASLAARYLDIVPFDGLIDRRNDEPMIFAEYLDVDPNDELNVSCSVKCDEPFVGELDIPSMPTLPFLSLDADAAVQKYITEVWIEKSTQNDWLVPLCRRRGVNLVVGIGEQSEIRSRQLAMRASKYGAPIRIMYLSDFDPGGRSMPKAVARKVEFTIAKFELDLDLQLIPLVLSPEQCREYRLPRTPIKETERRKDKFESIFGVGATELDALEALCPGEMARLLNAELDNWLDAGLDSRTYRLSSDLNILLRRIGQDIRAKYARDIETMRQSFSEITYKLAEINSRFDDWEERAGELWETIAAEMEDQRPDVSDVEIPRSTAPGKTDRFVLFDSRRDYFTQMDAYNTWRDGDETNGGAR